MLRKLTMVSLLLLFLQACGGGEGDRQPGLDSSASQACGFNFNYIFNTANDRWVCHYSTRNSITIRFDSNGTGYSSSIGRFEWSQTGCNSLSYVGEFGAVGDIVNLRSDSSGVYFTDQANGVDTRFTCTYFTLLPTSGGVL